MKGWRSLAIASIFCGVATADAGAVCPGDCDGDGRVRVDELVVGVNLALGNTSRSCDAFDVDGSGTLAVNELVLGVVAALEGCPSDPVPTVTPGGETIAIFVESMDRIVSEDGESELLQGRLAIDAISLVGDGAEVRLLGPSVVDLAVGEARFGLRGEIPEATYSGLSLTFAPPDDVGDMLDVSLRHLMSGETVTARSRLEIEGGIEFPTGPRVIRSASEMELVLRLQGLFFYLNPFSDAVGGVYVLGEDERAFLSMDLVAMVELRAR